MIPYVPTWEAHNTSAHVLVGKFTKAYCNVPRGKGQSQKYLIAVQSFLAFAQQLMGKNKDNIYLGISKDNNHWTPFAVGRVIIAKLRTDLEQSGIIQQLDGTGYKEAYQDKTGWWHTDGVMSLYEIDDKALFAFDEFVEAEFVESLKPPVAMGIPETFQQKVTRQKQGQVKPKVAIGELENQPQYSPIRTKVLDLDMFMRKHPLCLPRKGNGVRQYASSFTRVYHNKSWISGGRYYGAWTSLKSDYRLASNINDEPIAQIDLNASQPTLFSALFGWKMGVGERWRDLYSEIVQDINVIPTDDEKTKRDKIKQVAVEVIGTGNPFRQKEAKDSELVFDTELDEYAVYRDTLLSYVGALHLLNKEYLNGAGFISYHESQIMTETLYGLREKGIVAYPVHDAWLVKQSDVEEALYTIRLVIRDYIIKHCKHKRVVDITVPISVEVLGQDNKIEKVRHSGGYNC